MVPASCGRFYVWGEPTAAADVVPAPTPSRMNPVPRDERIPPVGASLLAKATFWTQKIYWMY